MTATMSQPDAEVAVADTLDAPSTEEPITRAGQRIFAAHFERLRACEDGVRSGDDAEAVHDMRVAARRLRSAFRLLGEHYPPEARRGVVKPLRDLARSLGALRDFDVMIEDLAQYTMRFSEERQRALEPLASEWRAQREVAHQAALEFLNSTRFAKWERAFEEFVSSAGMHPAPRVCDVIPALVWDHYQAVRQYEPEIGSGAPVERLHALRIECKRLRYALEFFRDLFGERAPQLIEPVVATQDHLGRLHDADVQRLAVSAYVAAQAQSAGASDARAMRAATTYLHFIQRRIARMQKGAVRPFGRLASARYRARLAAVVARL